MTREEKALALKIKNCFEAKVKAQQEFTRAENLIIARWLSVGVLSETAFVNIGNFGADYMPFVQMSTIYPFTQKGEDETTKGWYMRLRQSKAIAIIRDILTAIAFIVSLYLAVTKLLPDNGHPKDAMPAAQTAAPLSGKAQGGQ